MSNCILYVGGLAEATTDSQLRDLFGTYGAVVRVHVVRYKHSGKSAGYGFVEMGSDEQALCANISGTLRLSSIRVAGGEEYPS